METVTKQEAAERVMTRGTALESLFSVTLEFRFAGPAPCDPLGGAEEDTGTYSMSALYVAEVGADGVVPALRGFHTFSSTEGWTSDLQYFDHGGMVTAHNPFDGFVYILEDRTAGDAVVLRVSSACYRDPQPRAVFPGIYPE